MSRVDLIIKNLEDHLKLVTDLRAGVQFTTPELEAMTQHLEHELALAHEAKHEDMGRA